jgi:RHS repeat-associated protein
LQPSEIKASSSAGSAIDITYNFVDPVSQGNAGHVYGIANNLNSSRSQTFTYDQVNRILSAGTTATTGTYCWGYQYSYDAWGNLLSQAGWSPTYNACTETTMGAVTADGNNHISAMSYYASGNALGDGLYAYTWNGESQMKTAGGVTYAYDGDGRRAAKVGSKLYWYGSGGEILSETEAAGNTLNEYVYFGGKRVALVPATGGALYYAEDLLGSSRVMVQANGTLCYDADFTPFGGENAYTSTCSQSYKFEGKERDTETGNDDFGAREYSWRFGRWLSSDWSAVPVAVPYANLTNPQTLNLYSMVGDDPESFADLDGHTKSGCLANDDVCSGGQSPTIDDGPGGQSSPSTDGYSETDYEKGVDQVREDRAQRAQRAESASGNGGTTTIQHADGSTEIRTGTVAFRDHNPGDERSGNGAIGTDHTKKNGDFAIYPSDKAGFAALDSNLHSKYWNKSIAATMNSFAPKSDHNNPKKYANSLARAIGVQRGTKLSGLTSAQLQKLEHQIAVHEGFYVQGKVTVIPPSQ